jgi:threonine/homoserine/homoserine lactone efflux protein
VPDPGAASCITRKNASTGERFRAEDAAVGSLAASLPAFLGAVLLISASPGPAMALVVRRAALRGLRGAVPTVLGVELGLYVWALFAGAGLAALVAASRFAFVALRVLGAAVLIYLGVRAWRSRGDVEAGEEAVAVAWRRSWTGSFTEAAVVQLANPKLAVFMIAFYPQFVPASGPVFVTTALLGLVQVGVEIPLYLGLAAGVARAGAWFRRPRIRRRFEALSGAVLIGLGVRVAVATR